MRCPAVFERHPRKVGAAVLLLVFVAGLIAERGEREAYLPSTGTVTKAVDGDTLRVTGGGEVYRVRLIGVDTPEAYESDKLTREAKRTKQDKTTIMALGRRASAFTRKLCEGRECRLEYDDANARRGHRDRYQRLLAFVWVTDKAGAEVLVNAEIIRQGFGKAMTQFEFDSKRQVEFLRLQREARAEKRGLWGEWKP